jgi:chorismate synthase
MLRWLTAGESHGPELVAILEGMPAGVPVSKAAIQADLQRRKLGYGRGARMKFEEDVLDISGGIRFGLTMGSPIALRIGNTEWPRWVDVMSAEPVDVETLPKGRGAPLTRPRPGHADLVGMQKYDFEESRNVLERASARETAARVALGAVARAFLGELGIRLVAHTLAIGEVRVPDGAALPTADDVDALDADPLRCFDAATSAAMVARIDEAHETGDTLGGVVEVLAFGLPPGIGSYVHWDRRLDAQLAGALMSIQAIKGVEVGDGFTTTTRPGSAAHDELVIGADGITRLSDRAGGVEGGMSTGTLLRVRASRGSVSGSHASWGCRSPTATA